MIQCLLFWERKNLLYNVIRDLLVKEEINIMDFVFVSSNREKEKITNGKNFLY